MKSAAVVFTAPGRVSVEEIEIPEPGRGEVQIRTRYSCVSSGTEGWILHDRFTWKPTDYPTVPGYQRVGTITAVGEGVGAWRVGDAVMATSGTWNGLPHPFSGAHAAVSNAGVASLYALPAGVGEIDASGTVVIQVGYNAAYRPRLEEGDWVVVYGDGVIGQLGAQAARSRGARVIVVGHRPERLAAAARHSADHALPDDTDTVENIRALTGAHYVPVVIDTIQTPTCQNAYMPLLERGRGQIVYSGFSPEEPWASMTDLHQAEVTAHFIQGITRPRMEAALDLVAGGKLAFAPIVTHRVSFDRAPDVYRMIDARSEPFLGIVFEW